MKNHKPRFLTGALSKIDRAIDKLVKVAFGSNAKRSGDEEMRTAILPDWVYSGPEEEPVFDVLAERPPQQRRVSVTVFRMPKNRPLEFYDPMKDRAWLRVQRRAHYRKKRSQSRRGRR